MHYGNGSHHQKKKSDGKQKQEYKRRRKEKKNLICGAFLDAKQQLEEKTKAGYVKFILTSSFCYFCTMSSPSLRSGPELIFSSNPEVSCFKALSYQLPSDLKRAHMTCSDSSLRSFTFRGGGAGWLYVCVEGVAVLRKKRGPTLLEVVTFLCVCSIHLWIKALCVRVSVSIFVFLLRNRADFRAPGIKRQRSSSSLPYSPYLQHRWWWWWGDGVYRALRR